MPTSKQIQTSGRATELNSPVSQAFLVDRDAMSVFARNMRSSMVIRESVALCETLGTYGAEASLVAFETAVQRIKDKVFDGPDSMRKFKKKDGHDMDICFETEAEARSRRLSLWIANIAVFTNQLAYSFIFTSGWPYLEKLDPTADKYFMGWVVAATPVGMIVSSPLLGKWSDWLGSVRLPCVYCCLLTVFSSATYAMLGLIPSHRKYWMLANRFLSGTAGIVAPVRSYVSGATTLKERTPAFALLDLFQAIGFILGPAIQAALTPLGTGPSYSEYPVLSFDMYTSGGWVNTVLGILVTLLFIPGIFTEHKISKKEVEQNPPTNDSNDNLVTTLKPDYFAVWTCIFTFFVYQTNGIMAELLPTPIAMDQFAWTEEEAVKNNGIIIACLSVIATITFASVGALSKIYDDRKLLIYLGATPYVIGTIFLLPLGNKLPRMQQASVTQNTSQTTMQNLSLPLMHQELPSLYTNNSRNIPFNISRNDSLVTTELGLSASMVKHWTQGKSGAQNVKEGHISTVDEVITASKAKTDKPGASALQVRTRNSVMGTAEVQERKRKTVYKLNHSVQQENMTTSKAAASLSKSRNVSKLSTAPIEDQQRGCPRIQKWCHYIPAVTVSQFITGCVINTIGYAFTFSLIHSLLSKLLGPLPQGYWMGILTLSGSVAKAVGPVLFGFLYAYYGTYATFGTLLVTLVLSFLLLITMYNRLVPMRPSMEYIPLT